jgi:hypothetical protein
MWGGLIAGAISGGAQAAGQIADDQIKQNEREKLLRIQQEMEERRLVRADQLARERMMWEVDTSPDGYATKKTAAETAREKSVQGVRTDAAVGQARQMIDVDVDREKKLAPVKRDNAVSQAAAVKKAENQVALEDTLAKGSNKDYLKALGALNDANQSSAARASAAKTVYEMNRQKYVDNLRDVASGLMAAGDREGAEEQLRVADMASGKTPAKSFSDVAAFAKVLEAQAAALVVPMKGGDPMNPENVAQATAIRQRIQELAADVSSKRGVGGSGAETKPAAGPKEGDKSTSKSGKPIVYRNGQWVYQ